LSESRCRIDELAQKAGITVDTIRYYAREGLLPPPERAGRNKLYGSEHLDRLARIRDLQQQRFSLAAIRALLNADRPGIEDLFATTGRSYTFDDLVERSDLDTELVTRLRDVGLLADPITLGHEAYDDADLGLLRSVTELQEIGMTEDVLVALGEIYVRHFRALQADVHNMLAGQDREWDQDELVAIQRRLTANSQRMVPAVDRVLNYVHQRTIQRLTLEAVKTAEATQTGIGGVRLEASDSEAGIPPSSERPGA
jgi:DNA-binding transcriptional MerR regulator